MIPKCSLNGYNSYIQLFGLFSMAFILVIVVFYYLRIYHNNITEKYSSETKELNIKEYIYKVPTDAGDRSTYPEDKYPGAKMELIAEPISSSQSSIGARSTQNTNGSNTVDNTKDVYTFRDCKVYFTDDTDACDNSGLADNNPKKTCSYKFNDGWQEFNTYTDTNGQILTYPKKKYTRNASNTDELINSYFTSKCFKKFDNEGKGGPIKFEYQENSLVKYDSKGNNDNTEIDTNIFNGRKYTSIQFLNTTSPSDNLTNVIQSICSIKYNPFDALTGKTFYKLRLENKVIQSDIKKISLKKDQTGFENERDALADFAALSSHGLRFNSDNNLEVFINDGEVTTNMNIYKFSYVSNLCENSQIKSYTKYNSIPIVISRLIRLGGATVDNRTATIINFGEENMRLLASRRNTWKVTNPKTDYKKDILDYVESSRLGRISDLNIESEATKEAARKEIRKLDVKITEAYDTKNSFKKNTFLEVIGMEKTNANNSKVRIFDYTTGYRTNLRSFITIPEGAEAIFMNSSDICLIFKNNTGSNQKTYNFNIPSGETYDCDILVVGGGGGGGHFGGGGGGGGVLRGLNKRVSGSCSITVGNGGRGVKPGYNWNYDTESGTINGYDSSILINNKTYTARGGGGGGTRDGNARGRVGFNGGSGGGGSHSNEISFQASGGNSNKETYSGWNSYGNNGGKGKPSYYYCDSNNNNCSWRGEPSHASGGGGGAGGNGDDFSYSTGGGNGGLGVDMSETFDRNVGDNGYFSGGGGGNTYYNAGNAGYGNGGKGLFGGGGVGGMDWVDQGHNAASGKQNTGGGGGGGRWWWYWWSNQDAKGGDGGSGVVIMKIKKIITVPDISSVDDAVYSLDTTQSISIPSTRIQLGVVTSFAYLQKGFYRFRADIGNSGSSNPNIVYAELVLYDESNKNSAGKYNCKKVFKYNVFNNRYRASYLKQYIQIPTNKFYKIAYKFHYINNTNTTISNNFLLYYKYLEKAPDKLEGSMPDGLSAWYRFDGSINDINQSATKYPLTDTHSRNNFQNDTFQNRKYLNTNWGSVKTQNNIDLAGKSFSISVWMRTKNNDHCYFISHGQQHRYTCNDYLHIGSRGSGQYVLGFWCNDLEHNTSGGRSYPEDANTWVHMVFVVDVALDKKSCSRRMYRNGVEIARDSGRGLYKGVGVLYIGQLACSGEQHYRYNMDISDFLLFNDRALTVDDVEILYNSPPSLTEAQQSETSVLLGSDNDNTLFTRNSITSINTPFDYLYHGKTIYDHYNNANMIKIFSTITYKNNDYKGFQELAKYIDTDNIDYFGVRKLRADIGTQQAIIDGESSILTAKIDNDDTIIKLNNLATSIKTIKYRELLQPAEPQINSSISFATIFDNKDPDYITYEKVSSLNNLQSNSLKEAVYIEALN